ncbi:MAG: fatty acid desaturase [Bacteroidetes bacterium]|jgi:linoleoyl-CoA desaturase|nr:fatty acid desaturase [Bacteroidota bacterium]
MKNNNQISTIRFVDSNKNNLQFFSTLRKRVDEYFRENKISKHFNRQMIIKTVVLLSLYIGPFILMLIWPQGWLVAMLLWLVMGLAKAGIGMSVMHDANHGAYSSSHKANYWLGQTINLVGGSSFNWKLQHNILHHTYTNITDMDDDIESKATMRFSPHTKVKWYHKLQFIHAFAFYGILTLYWAIAKDFVQFSKYTKNGTNKDSKAENEKTFIKILLSKLVYLFVFFFVPVFILNISFLQILAGFLLMHFVAGVLLSVVFQLAHTVEGTSHPLPNDDGNIENNWAVHQMNTTVNFSRKNKLISWYVGGLNFQVEHHLFPNICHVHYPDIAEIVKTTAEEYGVPYLENKTLSEAIGSHIRMLRNLGKLPDINEAIA